jgi:hypothetical protein
MKADPLTLDRARSLRLDVLEPLLVVSEWDNQEFRKLALDVQYLIEYLEVYAFNPLSAEEVTELRELNVRVTKDIDDNYQRIMEAYDAYLTENPDENPDNPNQ